MSVRLTETHVSRPWSTNPKPVALQEIVDALDAQLGGSWLIDASGRRRMFISNALTPSEQLWERIVTSSAMPRPGVPVQLGKRLSFTRQWWLGLVLACSASYFLGPVAMRPWLTGAVAMGVLAVFLDSRRRIRSVELDDAQLAYSVGSCTHRIELCNIRGLGLVVGRHGLATYVAAERNFHVLPVGALPKPNMAAGRFYVELKRRIPEGCITK
jgi:hypothetical protein